MTDSTRMTSGDAFAKAAELLSRNADAETADAWTRLGVALRDEPVNSDTPMVTADASSVRLTFPWSSGPMAADAAVQLAERFNRISCHLEPPFGTGQRWGRHRAGRTRHGRNPLMKKTELVLILDRSGSMVSMQAEAEAGLNRFITEQRAASAQANDRVKVTFARFDDEYELVHDRIALDDIPDLRLEPRSLTALLDAVGKTVTHLKAWNDRNVIVVIVTDGLENASHEWKLAAVRDLIKDREALGWSFIFMGANIDAFAEGGALGVRGAAVMDYAGTAEGNQVAYASLSSNVTRSRVTGTAATFNEDEQEAGAATKTP